MNESPNRYIKTKIFIVRLPVVDHELAERVLQSVIKTEGFKGKYSRAQALRFIMVETQDRDVRPRGPGA